MSQFLQAVGFVTLTFGLVFTCVGIAWVVRQIVQWCSDVTEQLRDISNVTHDARREACEAAHCAAKCRDILSAKSPKGGAA